MSTDVPLPRGFAVHAAHLGVGAGTGADTGTDIGAGIGDAAGELDFTVVASEAACASAAVFTRSRFAGPSVVLSRAHAASRALRAAVVISKNANVATGENGAAHARDIVAGVAASLGVPAEHVLIASTGVIGRPYPMARIRAGIEALRWPFPGRDATLAARAIMTTDTHPKTAVTAAGPARFVGVAKGAGMIEPDMATMIALVFTDAAVDAAALDEAFRATVDRTFNALSIDTDTSTSDTAAVFANGMAGPVADEDLRAALDAVCTDLTRQLARDAEGATKLVVVTVADARDDGQAKRVAKAVVNSPLVKTAVHGADPNWGRVAMAVGKCHDEQDIDPDRVVIRFGDQEVYPAETSGAELARLERYMGGEEVEISVSLGIGAGRATVYGCDLSADYVRINADYTT